MSFGYSSRVLGYHELEKAIRDAQHKNVLIFAAASNDGGNRGRAFPARHDEVMCVHAADGNGNPSRFNPTPEKNRDNFSTLGEDVKSAWPVRLGGGGLNRHRYALCESLVLHLRRRLRLAWQPS